MIMNPSLAHLLWWKEKWSRPAGRVKKKRGAQLTSDVMNQPAALHSLSVHELIHKGVLSINMNLSRFQLIITGSVI